MEPLNELDQCPALETKAAFATYEIAFPSDSAEWLHPSILGTRQLRDQLREAVALARPLTRGIIETRFGPLSWEW
ncbi:MAG TPA: hypothetical protein VK530_16785 [Candidatus Acidoferrum sp.]|nr:hypothetical protein [Candidatus Acidoferrum sp.]